MKLNIDKDAFWHYSTNRYGKESVKNFCLQMQDTLDVNVNLLLLAGYLDELKITVTIQVWRDLIYAIDELDNALKCLRKARKKVKTLNQAAYQRLLETELSLEKQTQSLLVENLNGYPCQNNAKSQENLFRLMAAYDISLTSDLEQQLLSINPSMD